jgi:hypothetical protein
MATKNEDEIAIVDPFLRCDNAETSSLANGGSPMSQVTMFRLARDLRDTFRTVADNLDRHHKNVQIARIAGGSVATVGGGRLMMMMMIMLMIMMMMLMTIMMLMMMTMMIMMM